MRMSSRQAAKLGTLFIIFDGNYIFAGWLIYEVFHLLSVARHGALRRREYDAELKLIELSSPAVTGSACMHDSVRIYSAVTRIGRECGMWETCEWL